MGLGLKIMGLMNIQFVVMPGAAVYVIEVNPRASRTVPFLSKVTGVPMVKVATKIMLGVSLKEQGYETGLSPEQPLVGIKAPVFSMQKLVGVDTFLGPEMKSTGEVMGIAGTYDAALAKALVAAGLMLKPRSGVLFSVADRDKNEALPIIRRFAGAGCDLYATEGTAQAIADAGLPVKRITKKLSEGHPNVVDVIRQGTVGGVVNTVTGGRVPLHDGFEIRRAATDAGIPCFTSLDTARAAVKALAGGDDAAEVRPLVEYRLGVRN